MTDEHLLEFPTTANPQCTLQMMEDKQLTHTIEQLQFNLADIHYDRHEYISLFQPVLFSQTKN